MCVRVFCMCLLISVGDAAVCVEAPGWRPEGRVSDTLLHFQPLTQSGICHCEYYSASLFEHHSV